MEHDYTDIEIYTSDLDGGKPEFHATFSIQIGELAYEGWFDLSKSDWDFNPKYSEEQHTKLCEKITNHYYYREISLVPPGVWKREFLKTMNEIMPKYMPLYEMLDKYPSLFNTNSEYYKHRNIYSDFPQTRLQNSNQDYASSGNDIEYEKLIQLSTLDLYEKLLAYRDVDKMIIDEIEILFSPIFNESFNAF